MSSSEIPSKDAIRNDLQRRLDSVNKQLEEFDALREECRALEAALAALDGGRTPNAETDAPAPKTARKRGTREEVQGRRDTIAKMLEDNPSVSINEVAKAVDASYQTAANDIRLIRESDGQSF